MHLKHVTDHYLTRQQITCPFCKGYKAPGLVACWPCFRHHWKTMRSDDAEAVLDEFEDMLIREEDLREAGYVS